MNAPIPPQPPKSAGVPREASRAESVASPSRFQKFAATQAAGDGIQGDARKPDKTIDEKIGANMADRK